MASVFIALPLSSGGSVTSVNGQTGVVTITAAGLGAEVTTNKATDFTTVNDTLYPSIKAVNDKIAASLLGFSTFMFSSINSDIGGYESMPILSLYSAGALATITTAGVGTSGTLLATFATASNYPGITAIPVGLFSFYFKTQKSVGGINYYTYCELYKRASGGAETLLATSDNSAQTAANTLVQQTVTAAIATIITLLSTDRLVVKIYAKTLSSTASIDLTYDDTTNSRIEAPTTPLGYVPENVANRATDFTSLNGIKYPTTLAVDNRINGKTTALINNTPFI